MKKKNLIILIIIICLIILTIILIVKKNKKNNEKGVIGDNTFAISFLQTTNKKITGNYLVSPYSVEVALSMLRDGSNGNTKTEIDKAIGDKKVGLLDNKSVHVANALFIKNDYKDGVKSSFSDGLKNDYKSEVLYDEFKTPDVINNWVKKETDGMIDKVIDDMSEDFVLGLANALAIDVKWKYEFECNNTNSREFYNKNNEKSKVEMMHRTYKSESDVKYFENDKAKGIIIPYQDEDKLEFVAFKPNDNIDEFINSLTKDYLDDIDKEVKTPNRDLYIHLSLPRFKYDFDYKEFMSSLKDLGINDVFSPKDADLTNMMSRSDMNKYGTDNLYVGEAVHKTHVDLNEKGTKAAAVTYFGVYKNTAAIEDKQPEIIDMEFNKTFLYMIRDKETKKILFIGVVDEPNEWDGPTCTIER